MSRATWCLVPLFVAITAGYSAVCPATASAEEDCLRLAWQAFNRKDYKAAIESTNNCIDNFGRAATRAQAALKGTPVTPPGTHPAEEQEKIFKRGLLNDVGTAWFVKGRAAEHLMSKGGREALTYRKMAEEAYKAACDYPHALTFDPKGWFWSPCEASGDRLPLPQVAAAPGASPQARLSKPEYVQNRHE